MSMVMPLLLVFAFCCSDVWWGFELTCEEAAILAQFLKGVTVAAAQAAPQSEDAALPGSILFSNCQAVTTNL